MESDTMELLRLMLAHLRPRLQGRDEEWLAVIHDKSLLRTAGADVIVEQLTVPQLKQYRLEGTQEQIPLLEEVLEMEDAWAGAGERACAAHFFLGLQMGLDLGKLNYLREE